VRKQFKNLPEEAEENASQGREVEGVLAGEWKVKATWSDVEW